MPALGHPLSPATQGGGLEPKSPSRQHPGALGRYHHAEGPRLSLGKIRRVHEEFTIAGRTGSTISMNCSF
jgi:hypothetical protein